MFDIDGPFGFMLFAFLFVAGICGAVSGAIYAGYRYELAITPVRTEVQIKVLKEHWAGAVRLVEAYKK